MHCGFICDTLKQIYYNNELMMVFASNFAQTKVTKCEFLRLFSPLIYYYYGRYIDGIFNC